MLSCKLAKERKSQTEKQKLVPECNFTENKTKQKLQTKVKLNK